MNKEYLRLDKIEGPLIFLSGIKGAAYGEIIKIKVSDESERFGKVIRLDGETVIAQVFEGTSGLSTDNVKVKFTGKPFELSLSKEILGRTFNGVGQPIDEGGDIFSDESFNINGRPINPVARQYPRNYIQTGISTIDTLATLIRGQKLPVFSGNGLPHNELAAQIVRQAKISDDKDNKFAVVFAAIGVKHDDAAFLGKVLKLRGL